ncbi:MAG: hypothetical protein ABIF22_00375 [bacterium]
MAGIRKNPSALNSVAFDFYVFKNNPSNGHYRGRVFCRNTRKSCPFNSYRNEKSDIMAWMEQEA